MRLLLLVEHRVRGRRRARVVCRRDGVRGRGGRGRTSARRLLLGVRLRVRDVRDRVARMGRMAPGLNLLLDCGHRIPVLLLLSTRSVRRKRPTPIGRRPRRRRDRRCVHIRIPTARCALARRLLLIRRRPVPVRVALRSIITLMRGARVTLASFLLVVVLLMVRRHRCSQMVIG